MDKLEGSIKEGPWFKGIVRNVGSKLEIRK